MMIIGRDEVLKCHSPHGECGLKSVLDWEGDQTVESLPAWGVRVEIS